MSAKISVIPALQYNDAKAAIEFLCKAFGFAKNAVYEEPDGSVAHAQLTHGNGMVMLGSVNFSLHPLRTFHASSTRLTYAKDN